MLAPGLLAAPGLETIWPIAPVQGSARHRARTSAAVALLDVAAERIKATGALDASSTAALVAIVGAAGPDTRLERRAAGVASSGETLIHTTDIIGAVLAARTAGVGGAGGARDDDPERTRGGDGQPGRHCQVAKQGSVGEAATFFHGRGPPTERAKGLPEFTSQT